MYITLNIQVIINLKLYKLRDAKSKSFSIAVFIELRGVELVAASVASMSELRESSRSLCRFDFYR